MRSATLRTARLTSRTTAAASRQVVRTGRSVKAKVEAGGDLDVDSQVKAVIAQRARQAATHRALTKFTRGSGEVGYAGAVAAESTASTVTRSTFDGGQLDVDDTAARAARYVDHQANRATLKAAGKTAKVGAKAGAKVTVATAKAGAKAGVAGAKLTGRAAVGGARLTGQAARRGAQTSRRAAVATRKAGRAAAGATARVAVHTAAGVARAVTMAKAAIAATIAAAGGATTLAPVVAVIAVVALLCAILPSWITGVGQQAESEAAAVVIPAACGANTYQLGAVKPHVEAAAVLLGRMFGVDSIGGWRASSNYDPGGHPAGLALDLMVPVNDAGETQGWAISNYAQAHHLELGIQYMIFHKKIWSVGRANEGWRDMEDRGDDSANHLDHVHISFYETPGTGVHDDMFAAVCDPQVPVATGGWTGPVKNLAVSSKYGMRFHPVKKRWSLHTGTDYASGGCGTPIYAAAAGKVASVTTPSWAGRLVTINHGAGIESRYAHMDPGGVLVAGGQDVAAGQMIARIGNSGWSTGCHLHFEIKVAGSFVDPVGYLRSQGVTHP